MGTLLGDWTVQHQPSQGINCCQCSHQCLSLFLSDLSGFDLDQFLIRSLLQVAVVKLDSWSFVLQCLVVVLLSLSCHTVLAPVPVRQVGQFMQFLLCFRRHCGTLQSSCLPGFLGVSRHSVFQCCAFFTSPWFLIGSLSLFLSLLLPLVLILLLQWWLNRDLSTRFQLFSCELKVS